MDPDAGVSTVALGEMWNKYRTKKAGWISLLASEEKKEQARACRVTWSTWSWGDEHFCGVKSLHDYCVGITSSNTLSTMTIISWYKHSAINHLWKCSGKIRSTLETHYFLTLTSLPSQSLRHLRLPWRPDYGSWGQTTRCYFEWPHTLQWLQTSADRRVCTDIYI